MEKIHFGLLCLVIVSLVLTVRSLDMQAVYGVKNGFGTRKQQISKVYFKII
jgi:hypothetical protein